MLKRSTTQNLRFGGGGAKGRTSMARASTKPLESEGKANAKANAQRFTEGERRSSSPFSGNASPRGNTLMALTISEGNEGDGSLNTDKKGGVSFCPSVEPSGPKDKKAGVGFQDPQERASIMSSLDSAPSSHAPSSHAPSSHRSSLSSGKTVGTNEALIMSQMSSIGTSSDLNSSMPPPTIQITKRSTNDTKKVRGMTSDASQFSLSGGESWTGSRRLAKPAVAPLPKRTSLRYSFSSDIGGLETKKGIKASCKHFLRVVMFSQQFEMFVGMVIIANFVVIAWETDVRAQEEAAELVSEKKRYSEQLFVILLLNYGFLAFYFLECVCRMFVMGTSFFHYKWNLFDLFIVVCGVLGDSLEAAFQSAGEGVDVQVLRSMRMIRLLRASRILISFHELYSLISGLTNCMKTLSWAGGLVFMMLTMWSIIAVEYMNPLMKDLDAAGMFDGCYWCPEAFQSILFSNLTLFQIITGDGWSHLARPLIERHPWTVFIFVGIIFTLLFGLLNLITAVIVDTAHKSSEMDIMNLANRKRIEREEAWECFSCLGYQLDKDNSGDITLAELVEGVHEIPELRAYLSIMGVEDDDLHTVFDLLDNEQTGILNSHEFVSHLYKMKTQEVGMGITLMKKSIDEMRKHIKCMSAELVSTDKLSKALANNPNAIGVMAGNSNKFKIDKPMASKSTIMGKVMSGVSDIMGKESSRRESRRTSVQDPKVRDSVTEKKEGQLDFSGLLDWDSFNATDSDGMYKTNSADSDHENRTSKGGNGSGVHLALPGSQDMRKVQSAQATGGSKASWTMKPKGMSMSIGLGKKNKSKKKDGEELSDRELSDRELSDREKPDREKERHVSAPNKLQSAELKKKANFEGELKESSSLSPLMIAQNRSGEDLQEETQTPNVKKPSDRPSYGSYGLNPSDRPGSPSSRNGGKASYGLNPSDRPGSPSSPSSRNGGKASYGLNPSDRLSVEYGGKASYGLNPSDRPGSASSRNSGKASYGMHKASGEAHYDLPGSLQRSSEGARSNSHQEKNTGNRADSPRPETSDNDVAV